MASTDAYINSVMKAAPRTENAKKEENSKTLDGMVNESDAARRRSMHKKETGVRTALACQLISLNFLLFASGCLLIAIGIYGSTLDVLKVLTTGKAVAMGVVALGAFLVLLSLFGCIGGKTKNGCILIIYMILLSLVTLAVVAIVVVEAIFIYRKSTVESGAKELWTSQIKRDATVVCDWQSFWNCSGFDHVCWNVTTNSSVTPFPDDCPNCVQISLMQNKMRCWDALEKSSSNFDIVFYVSLGVVLILIVLMMLTCCLTIHRHTSEKNTDLETGFI